jgi:hypothetical protein
MPKANVVVLYHESAGAGVDQEHTRTGQGVDVQLEKWTTGGENWRVRDHYVLLTSVMVDREIVAESYTAKSTFRGGDDPERIRKAIAAFDALVGAHPKRAELTWRE